MLLMVKIFMGTLLELKLIINSLDKTYIDDVLKERATIENIAIYIIKRLKEFNNLYSVVVYEGRDKYIEILKEEIEWKKHFL